MEQRRCGKSKYAGGCSTAYIVMYVHYLLSMEFGHSCSRATRDAMRRHSLISLLSTRRLGHRTPCSAAARGRRTPRNPPLRGEGRGRRTGEDLCRRTGGVGRGRRSCRRRTRCRRRRRRRRQVRRD